MQRASRQPAALVHATSSTASAQSSSISSSFVSKSGGANREYVGRATAEIDSPATDVVISPAGTFISDEAQENRRRRTPEAQRQLMVTIRLRIESRLGGRVRDLAVRIKGDTVLLEGKCYTYYTKQLAQHAALGVLEDEHLENGIVVEVPR